MRYLHFITGLLLNPLKMLFISLEGKFIWIHFYSLLQSSTSPMFPSDSEAMLATNCASLLP